MFSGGCGISALLVGVVASRPRMRKYGATVVAIAVGLLWGALPLLFHTPERILRSMVAWISLGILAFFRRLLRL